MHLKEETPKDYPAIYDLILQCSFKMSNLHNRNKGLCRLLANTAGYDSNRSILADNIIVL